MRRVDHLIAGLDEAPKRPVQVPLALWTEIEFGLLDQQDDAGDLRLAAGFQRLADGGLSQRAIGGRPAEDVGELPGLGLADERAQRLEHQAAVLDAPVALADEL